MAARQVWERFHFQPEISVEVALGCIVDVATKEDLLVRSPGPRPWEGTVTHTRTVDKSNLYVMALTGHNSGPYVKIGIASVVKRRLREVNQYFPPGLNLGWTVELEIEFPNAFLAYLAEQRTLDDLRKCLKWIGREFAAVEVNVAKDIATKNARDVIADYVLSN
ncbi:GIY-YIG nuclease family protein [Agrobacterium cavarae]|uniref:GIY-YIG nuclease family protein n=1 Tax=Agrobacterium cavarae TaxID=2528239 RepID=UPI003FD2DF4C